MNKSIKAIARFQNFFMESIWAYLGMQKNRIQNCDQISEWMQNFQEFF
jgi:hypothetical protein